MISTRFGSPIVLLDEIDEEGWVWVLVKYPQPKLGESTFQADRVREYHISELKADGGLNEIQAASDRLKGTSL